MPITLTSNGKDAGTITIENLESTIAKVASDVESVDSYAFHVDYSKEGVDYYRKAAAAIAHSVASSLPLYDDSVKGEEGDESPFIKLESQQDHKAKVAIFTFTKADDHPDKLTSR